jgi:phosphonate transport system substrate-binding protein
MAMIEDSVGARSRWRVMPVPERPAGASPERRCALVCCGWKIRMALKALSGMLLFALHAAAPAAPGALNFGVFPQLSTRAMAETYQPLANHLGESTGRPVSLVTAKDFNTFHTRTVAGEYDLVLTAPHLAWLASKEGGYRPLLVYKEPAKGFVVVRKDSPIGQLTDLRGKTIAIPDPNAVVNIRLTKILSKSGLDLGHELTVKEAGSHTNAATYVTERQADAAVVGVFPFLQLPAAIKDNLRIIASTPDLPSQVYLVPPRTSASQEQTLRQAIEKFMQGEDGAIFLKKTGFGGVRALKKNELMQVESDARELKRRFGVQETHAAETAAGKN